MSKVGKQVIEDNGRAPYDAMELAAFAQDIERRIKGVLCEMPCDIPGPALLALLRVSASLIALAQDRETLDAALSCAKDILDHRARQGTGHTLH